ncbi:MAG: HAMP domain-containing sensor histidine kinase [Romboutsia sp.]
MKSLFNKWEKLNIKYKLFSITTGLLLALAIIIYLILYFLLPSYYHKYKIENLQQSIITLVDNSKDYSLEELKYEIQYISRDQNLVFLLRDSTGKIVYGKNELVLLNYNRYFINKNSDEYATTVFIYTNNSHQPYKLDIIMPLQPVDEASEVIRTLMPYILVVAVFIATIGAYIYSTVITKPLINIIESEREEENRRKDFIATISHELKTPITIISGQLEGMIYNIGKYKDRDTYLKKSYDSTQELKDLVEEMMNFSKFEILESDLKISEIDISNLLERLVQRQTFLIEEKSLKISTYISENIEILADEEKITKAINNIINNAIKYSPDGESIIIRLYKKANNKSGKKINREKIYLEVENTGVKIEKKYIDDIFNPFFRIEKSRSRKTGGSGLGLYIVSQTLKSHGFDYSIKNKNNSVIFTIQF